MRACKRMNESNSIKINYFDSIYISVTLKEKKRERPCYIFQMTEVHSFGNLPVIAHAWNKDRTRMLSILFKIHYYFFIT